MRRGISSVLVVTETCARPQARIAATGNLPPFTEPKELSVLVSHWWLYVLELANRHWYVGIAKDVDKRFQDHCEGKGAEWTQVHPPISVRYRRCLETDDPGVAHAEEARATIAMMKRHGVEYVRGAKMVDPDPISSYVWNYARKSGACPTVIEEIMSYARAEDVPIDLWSLCTVKKADEFKSIRSSSRLNLLLKQKGLSMNDCDLADDAQKRSWARWVLRGLSPRFALYKIKLHIQ